jgi:murein DD-endopeptidase MepM/ murein hydrolase activator NlpD
MKKLVTLFLCMTLVLPSVHVPAQTKAPAKVKELKSDLKELNSEKKEVASELRKTKRDASYVLDDIQKVDGKMEIVESKLGDSTEKLGDLNREAKKVEKNLREAKETMNEQTEIVRVRMKRLYMQSEGSALGAMLASDSLGDMAARREIFDRIADKDKETFDRYKKEVTKYEVEKTKKESLIAETKEVIASQKEWMQELAEHRKIKRGFLTELRQAQSKLQDEFDELDKESRQIEAKLAAFENANRGMPAFNGQFRRPVSGRITSGYGYRNHPILKRRKLHAGIDFGAPTGTPVYASSSGVVVSAGYQRGYGNTIVISHGSGLSTLYGHLSRIRVSSGQKVGSGDLIGNVGSTGMSTGPHLHFEIRVNGRPVNPAGRL